MLTWPDLTSRARGAPDATVAYGDDPLQVADLWRPAGDGPHPVVVMVHGGCWQTSIADRRLMDWAAANLRAAGIAVWNIDYRGVDRAGGGYPGTFRDVAAAADRLRDAAADFALDLRGGIAIGHSAGGHLALWLAARHRLSPDSPLHRPAPLAIGTVICLGGLPDLAAVAASPDNGCGTEVIARLVDPSRPSPYADTSLPPLLPIDAVQHLVNGREDRIVPLRLGEAYVAQAQAAGDDARLHTVADTGHVELITPGTAAWTHARALVVAAVERDR
ncbi:alpha/beta hydrolase family protein [Sphingomonas sp. CV7422]|uniref:alpha/beta hydrolase family protein n=1 Tax=Sphingomonas sp. CV7422 TaxID=3018036 RepID=UPI0022FE7D46|nr:alpha/beta hydrolase [Sphingomonas sp. CV7422]